MRKTNVIFAAAAATGAIAFAVPAFAGEGNPAPIITIDSTHLNTTCKNLKDAYVNPDETIRKPVVSLKGLVFGASDPKNQLIHFPASTTVEHLKPGYFVAYPTPDQDSFFSVEVSGTDGKYGTLRWNTTNHKWEVTTQGNFYQSTSPAALVDMPPLHLSHHVVSFGVGYTNTPAGNVKTTVSKIEFGGHAYDLTCCPKPTPTRTRPHPTHSTSPSASTSPSSSTSPSTSASASPSSSASKTVPPTTDAPTGSPSASQSSNGGVVQTTDVGNNTPGGALAVTGPSVWTAAGVGTAIVAVGAFLLVAMRKRKAKFTA